METKFFLDSFHLEKDLESLSSDFPNLRVQFPKIQKAFRDQIRISPIIVPLLLPQNQFAVFSYMPKGFGHNEFSHEPMYHGISVGHFHEKGDSFDDLDKIMSNGFHSDSNAENVYVTVSGMWDAAFKPQRYMTPTRRKEIQGDKYLLLISKAEVPPVDSAWLSSAGRSYDLLVHHALIEDISLRVDFSNLYHQVGNPADQVKARMEFYLKRYPGKVSFYKGSDTAHKTLRPKDFGIKV
jgi:hypothetical protein